MPTRLARALRAALLAALFFTVFGANLDVINRYGSSLPHWDQWDAEGEQAILPYLQHRLTLGSIIAPHNEHRVACTRLLALGLVMLNGQWDARLECVVNAGLFAAIAVAIYLYGGTLLGRRRRAVWFAAVAGLTAPPIAWQNVISGFHSQQYFLIGFSLAALALLLTAPPWSGRWWAGLACAFVALFTMASGLLAAAAVFAVLVVDGRPRDAWRRHIATLAACLVVVALGWMLQVTIPQNALLEAHTVSDFLVTFWRSLQWPAERFAPMAVLAWSPWVLLGWRLWRRRGRADRREWVLFAAGLWVILQFAATAYGRGAGGSWPASRYLDTVAIGLLVNVLALLVLAAGARPPVGRRWLGPAAAVAWFAVVGMGVVRHVARVFAAELPPVATELRREAANTRAYLATGDAHWLDGAIPYPNKKTLIERLGPSAIRSVLPASVRPPVNFQGTADPRGSFVRKGFPAGMPRPPRNPDWGSFTTAGNAAEGEWHSVPIFQPFSGYWRFDVAGDLGRKGLDLDILAHTTGTPLARVLPSRPPGARWESVTVPAPGTSAAVVARDTSPTGWFAFTAPVEVGPLSYWARRLAAAGREITLVSGVAALLLLLAGLLGPDRNLPAPAGE